MTAWPTHVACVRVYRAHSVQEVEEYSHSWWIDADRNGTPGKAWVPVRLGASQVMLCCALCLSVQEEYYSSLWLLRCSMVYVRMSLSVLEKHNTARPQAVKYSIPLSMLIVPVFMYIVPSNLVGKTWTAGSPTGSWKGSRHRKMAAETYWIIIANGHSSWHERLYIVTAHTKCAWNSGMHH